MSIPKGKLIPIGGNESKNMESREDPDPEVDFQVSTLKEVIAEMKGSPPKILLLPLASNHQEEIIDIYRAAFGQLGHDIEIIFINDKKELDDRKNLEKLYAADSIFITGGDQAKLKHMLEGSDFLDILKEKYHKENFVIAGTSAGAMILSEFMIDSGGSEESLLKGVVELSHGLGFLPGTIIDTHFLERGRFSRLTEALLKKNKFTGIGISEDTGVVITGGKEMRAIGSGTVLVIESDEIKNTNYNSRKSKEPVYIENLVIHILSRGTAYLLREKKFIVL